MCASAYSLRFILCEAGHYVPRYILGVFSPLREGISAKASEVILRSKAASSLLDCLVGCV